MPSRVPTCLGGRPHVFAKYTTAGSASVGNMTAKPTFLVVDDDGDTVEALERDLTCRFGADHEIRAASSVRNGLSALEMLRDRAELVAVVIADLAMPETIGVEFLVMAMSCTRTP